ncbi:MAG: hypothetical protein A3C82_00125 [Candidatus Wildermuthbacteria bacterium RIFCSPHIGHO2_02_FULL_47_12]|uniref:Uncharacterized protein n=1 Tax=Candidatus Wildermuthbacteria bacterium RIFCSPHIGHO2_02_FULL_47_12 TaxID=1802451 RepID=A0A1G2R4F0_9BACT|nr:MAG: hypothetical protein A3C82_00125 [Candidatus Wildermuthbacteria bacterium RIFCSPHIGHO2_02_FULL_47_12]
MPEVSKEEILKALALCRDALGEKRVRGLRISDDWGHGITLAVLLLQNPGDRHYESGLEDPQTREWVFQAIRSIQQEQLAQA